MIGQLTLPTPLHRLNRLSSHWGVELWIKRDDLIPQFFGGNKVRKAKRILEGIDPDTKVLITNGGADSNHARVVALMGVAMGKQVHLVLHGSRRQARGNGYIAEISGAQLHYVDASGIADKISDICRDEQAQGNPIAVIPGGGHSPDGVAAYADAVGELPFQPDYIFHASGTGGTQAGIIRGVANRRFSTEVIGVSVAREAERGRQEITKLLPECLHDRVRFDDRFRFGGYEKTTPELDAMIRLATVAEGIPFDPTYTGKALYGLGKMIEMEEINPDNRILFWHTGGLMNLFSHGWGEQ